MSTVDDAPLGYCLGIPVEEPIPDGWLPADGRRILRHQHDFPVPPDESGEINLPEPEPEFMIGQPGKKLIVKVRLLSRK